MNTVQLAGTNNIPLTSDLLAFMQSAYTMLEKFAKLGGDNYILTGCTVTGASVSDGFVVVGGQLMPFKSGTIQENVRVVTTTNNYTVGGGTEAETSFSAEFGTSTNPAENIAWGTLSANRIDNMLTLKAGVANINYQVNAMEQQLSVLNRSIVAFCGNIHAVEGITTKMVQPSVTISGVTNLQTKKHYVTHDIGNTNYFVIPFPSHPTLARHFKPVVEEQSATGFTITSYMVDGSISDVAVDFMIIAFPITELPDHGSI